MVVIIDDKDIEELKMGHLMYVKLHKPVGAGEVIGIATHKWEENLYRNDGWEKTIPDVKHTKRNFRPPVENTPERED